MDTSVFRGMSIAKMTANGYMTEEQALQIKRSFGETWPEAAEVAAQAAERKVEQDAAMSLTERLGRLNRAQRRAVIVRAKKAQKKAARAAAQKGRGK